jgi:hypothetical protein
MGQFYQMAQELGFPRHKPGDGRAGTRAPPRSQRRANDPSRRAVTRKALDVARHITDVTAQLEAVAIKAHLDRLAYFLGMAKVESELIVRTNGDPEAERSGEESGGLCEVAGGRVVGTVMGDLI